jgi:hypothetical protein
MERHFEVGKRYFVVTDLGRWYIGTVKEKDDKSLVLENALLVKDTGPFDTFMEKVLQCDTIDEMANITQAKIGKMPCDVTLSMTNYVCEVYALN